MLFLYLALATEEEKRRFEVLWEKYSLKLLKRVSLKISDTETAQDIVGDSFVALMNHYERYSYLDEVKIKALLITISDNLVINYQRKSSRIKFVPIDEEKEASLPNDTLPDGVEEIVFSKMKMEKLEKAIEALDEKYSSVLKMRLYGGLAYSDISELLGISAQAARKRYERGRKEELSAICDKDE